MSINYNVRKGKCNINQQSYFQLFPRKKIRFNTHTTATDLTIFSRINERLDCNIHTLLSC